MGHPDGWNSDSPRSISKKGNRDTRRMVSRSSDSKSGPMPPRSGPSRKVGSLAASCSATRNFTLISRSDSSRGLCEVIAALAASKKSCVDGVATGSPVIHALLV